MYYGWVRWLRKSQLYLLLLSAFFFLATLFQLLISNEVAPLVSSRLKTLPSFDPFIHNQTILRCKQRPLLHFPPAVLQHLHAVRLFGVADVQLVDAQSHIHKPARVSASYYFTPNGFSEKMTALSAKITHIGSSVAILLQIDGQTAEVISLPILDGLEANHSIPEMSAILGNQILLKVGKESSFVNLGQLIEIHHPFWTNCRILSKDENCLEVALYDRTGVWKRQVAINASTEQLQNRPAIKYIRYRSDQCIWCSLQGVKQPIFLNQGFNFVSKKWIKAKQKQDLPFLQLITINEKQVEFAMQSAMGTKREIFTVMIEK